jgi:hypothetical protein
MSTTPPPFPRQMKIRVASAGMKDDELELVLIKCQIGKLTEDAGYVNDTDGLCHR